MSEDSSVIHHRAKRLFEHGQYAEMISDLSMMPRQRLVEDPELGMLAVNAMRRLQRVSEALELLLLLEEPIYNSGNPGLVRRWQIGYAVYLRHQGKLADSMSLLADTMSQAESVNDFRSVAFACNGIGIAALNLGDLENAVRHWLRAIVAWTSIGDQGGVGLGHYNLSIAYRESGLVAEAFNHFALAQEYLGVHGTAEEKMLLKIERVLLLVAISDLQQAERVVRAACGSSKRMRNEDLLRYAERVLGTVLVERGQLEDGERILANVIEYWKQKPNRSLEAEINEDLAVVSRRLGQFEMMELRRDAALAYYADIGAEQRRLRLLSRLEDRVRSQESK